jgi:hypothetical protein
MTFHDNTEADWPAEIPGAPAGSEAELPPRERDPNARDLERTQAAAARNLADAVYHAKHALDWLQLDKPAGVVEGSKPVGSVPWRYDLREALDLLDRASESVKRALATAVDPDRVS